MHVFAIIISIFVFAGQGLASKESTLYLLNPKGGEVKIIKSVPSETNGTYMRIPNQGERKSVPKKAPVIAKKISLPIPKKAGLAFNKMKIKGSDFQPRVKFARTNLAVPRADESLPSDFYDLIFENN
jgi:hypothetical protein